MTDDTNPGANPVPVTIIGLGAMGTALARAFLRAGHPTTVWNRSAERADGLVADGASRAATASAAAAASPLVIACLLDHGVARRVLEPAADVLGGRVLVNLTNGTPAEAAETAAWASARNIAYLDGGIMATPPLIGRPEAFILYSGRREAFDRHGEVLGVLGAAKYLGTDPGLASLYDLALLSGMYGMVSGVRHASEMVGAERAAAFTSSLMVPLLQAMAGTLAEAPAAGSGTEDEVSPLGMQAVGLANIIEASRAGGTGDELLTHLLTPMRDIAAAGHGDVLRPLIDSLHAPSPAGGTAS